MTHIKRELEEVINMPGGRSKYFFFNKKKRAPDKVNSAQITSAEDKKQKNIFEFFGRGKRKEPTGHELIASGEGSECKRSRKTELPRYEAEERIGEKLDEFRARESFVDDNFSYIAQSYGVSTVSSIVTNGDTAAQMQDAESSNPTPLEKQACGSYVVVDIVHDNISISDHRAEAKISKAVTLH